RPDACADQDRHSRHRVRPARRARCRAVPPRWPVQTVTGRLKLTHLLIPHWPLLALAFSAMLVESGADLLEPWPLKIVFDHVLGAKPHPTWMDRWAPIDLAADPMRILTAAALAVIGIAMIGAAGAYCEKYFSTNVATRVAHDLRHMLYHHV